MQPLLTSRLAVGLVWLALALGTAAAGRAQVPLAPGADAYVLRRGQMRLSLSAMWERYDSQYGAGSSFDGVEPLGARFSGSSLGTESFASLLPLENRLGALAQNPAFKLSIGRTETSIEASTNVTPLSLEVGVTNWLSLRAMVPLVRTVGEVLLEVNRDRTGGNVGLNPALSLPVARTANVQIRDQLSGAASQLEQLLMSCLSDPGGAGCSAVNDRRAEAQALVAESRQLRDNLESVYGSDTITSQPFVPLAGSSAEEAIAERIAVVNSAFRELLSVGMEGADPVSGRPFAAQTPVTAAELRGFLEDAQYGYGYLPLASFRRQGAGDMEVGVQLRLIDGFGDRSSPLQLRVAVGALARFGTGKPADPDLLVDLATGDGQNDIELSGALDLGIGRRLSVSGVVRYTQQLEDELIMRIAPQGTPFRELFRRRLVTRDLGDYLDIQIAARLRASRFFTFAGLYSLRSRGEDNYSGRYDVSAEETGGDALTLDAGVMNAGTDAEIHRVGAALAISNFEFLGIDPAAIPMQITYTRFQTISASGYGVPDTGTDIIALRIYPGFLNR